MDAEADFYLEKGPNPHVQYTSLVYLIRRAVRRARGSQEEHEFSRFSLDHISEGVLWTDGRGTILSANRAAAASWPGRRGISWGRDPGDPPHPRRIFHRHRFRRSVLHETQVTDGQGTRSRLSSSCTPSATGAQITIA